MSGRLGADAGGVHRLFHALNDVVVDTVLHIRSSILDSKEPPTIGFILREQESRRTFTMQPAPTQTGMVLQGQDSAPVVIQSVPGVHQDFPMTTYCGTKSSAGRAAWQPPDRDSPP